MHYDIAPNLGLLEYRDNAELTTSLLNALRVNWEVPIAAELMPKLMKMTNRFGKKKSKRFRDVMQNKNRSARLLKPLKFPASEKL
jgi:hypothetical protein